ncbi:MAG: dihydroorotase [Desulforhopalus sp.]|jgi:dihydroorotase
MKPMRIELQSPLDMHLHLREGDMMRNVTPLSAAPFAGGVIMPNLISPVDSLAKLNEYKKEILLCDNTDYFTPYMTLFFKEYTRQELAEAKDYIIGIKLYPAGVTTQSENGVSDFSSINSTLGYMEELGIPLLVHGETGGFVMDREKDFLPVYQQLAETFPKLHIVMEHITTADAIQVVDRFENVSATVTLHHLMITLDDVAGGLLEPDLFCKPIAKTPKDLAALQDAVFSGHPRIMFGSDSAPHPRHKKECCGCAAGIFSAPVALPMLAQLFEDAGKLDLMQAFVSDIACSRYGLQPVEKNIILERKPWQVPELYHNLKPFGAGQTLRWSQVE